MIFTYGLSLTGSSHLASGTPCQDYHAIRTLKNGWTIAAVADGVGSARYSEFGARTAVNRALNFVETYLPDTFDVESLKALLRIAFLEAKKAVFNRARWQKHQPADYDTTLTAVIYNGKQVVWGHVGDGGIIALTPYGELLSLTTAQKGKYFNEVIPLRSAPDSYAFGASTEEVCALTLMTDGLYDVAVPPVLQGELYINFLRQFVDINIIDIVDEPAAAFQQTMEDYLNSSALKFVTDDKTVVGLINVDMMPEVREETYYREPDWQALREEQQRQLYPAIYAAEKGDEAALTDPDTPGKETLTAPQSPEPGLLSRLFKSNLNTPADLTGKEKEVK